MKAKQLIGAIDELGLQLCEGIDARLEQDPGAPRRAARELEIDLEVPRFGGVQSGEKLTRRTADRRPERRETLAGAGLDERTANHEIDLALWFSLGNQAPQSLGVAPRSEPVRLDT
jgi:hypothetical protein